MRYKYNDLVKFVYQSYILKGRIIGEYNNSYLINTNMKDIKNFYTGLFLVKTSFIESII